MSLDVFRGATIALMILVNDPGDGATAYWPLRHSLWNGWTPTDLVFPFFVFIVGVAMAFSFSSRLKQGVPRSKLMAHVLWRGAVLFALGLFVNAFPHHFHFATWRVYGVLQRIALCYVITAVLALWTDYRAQIVIAVSCLVGYWMLMRYVSVPGYGVPKLDIPILDPDRNLVAWLDRKLLMGHLYEGTRDPEGLLSTIPALGNSILGLLAGQWLRSQRSALAKFAGLAFAGIALYFAGEIFNVWFPINKKLWTSSFVLLTVGLAMMFLATFYWILDMRMWRGRWTKPFLIFGTNAIAAYVFSETAVSFISWHGILYDDLFEPLFSPPNASLLYAITYTLICLAVVWMLYRKKIFLKV